VFVTYSFYFTFHLTINGLCLLSQSLLKIIIICNNNSKFPPTLHSTLEIQPATLFGEKCVIIDKCRICGTEGETIEHIISSCTVLTQSEYKKRHGIFEGKIITRPNFFIG
jgi:hypothetical protein